MQLTFSRIVLAATLALGLSACGGGSGEAGSAQAATATVDARKTAAAAGPRATVATAPVGVEAAADQLMNLGELMFPDDFPAHQTSQTVAGLPFSFRYFPESGTYLGVVVTPGQGYETNGVYVMGGAFGAAPLLVGRVGDFIAPSEVNASYAISLSAAKTAVTQGGSTTLTVGIDRAAGFAGQVTLTMSGLPAGVTASAVTIAANANTANLVLTAQGGAAHSVPTGATLHATASVASANDTRASLPLAVTVRGAPGTVDTTWAGGLAKTPIDLGEDYAKAVAVQADGKTLVAGSSATVNGTVVSLVRYLRDGGLDPSFGNGGKVLTKVGQRSDIAYAIALQQDGKIVVAGSTDQESASGLDFMVLRYRTDGTLDPAFGNGGKVVTAFSPETDRAFAVVIQSDGRIVVGGETLTNSSTTGVDFALARYLPDGTLDEVFGDDGKVVTPISTFAGKDTIYALALTVIDGRQRILAVGGEGDFIAARYTNTGSLDAFFGVDGKVNALFNSVIGAARAVTMLPDGRAVVAGDIGNDFAAVQLKTDGTLDTTFGSGGKFSKSLAANDNWDQANAIVRQADGKLLLAGWAYSGNSSSGDFAALRLNANGTLDGSFGTAGILIKATAPGTKDDQSHGIALQVDDRIPGVRAIQAGEANDSNHDFSVIRLWL